MGSSRFHLAYKNIRRLRRIATTFARYGFRPFMDRMHLGRLVAMHSRIFGAGAPPAESLTVAARFRCVLEELGPTFIKFGQILSTRPDIIPEEFLIELLKLQDEVAPISFKEVKGVIEGQFGRPVEALFSSIEREPVAAASIAQVHRAITSGGREVVIKVQRPGIEATIDTDISILGFLADLAERHIPEIRIYDPKGVVEEFSLVIRREMDFTLEASYTERFRENFADDKRVVIPAVLWELTGRKVLTMDRVSGIKIDKLETLRQAGIDTEKVAHLLADLFFKQVFDLGLFHGDMHSGNIFVVAEDKIAFVDFGIVGRLDNTMRRHLADILISFAMDDFEGLIRVYQKMKILPEDLDKTSFEREYYDIMLHYFGRPLKHARVGELMLEYSRLAARYNVRLPRELLLFDKCLIELEGLARLLYPDVNIIDESAPYAQRLFRQRFEPAAVFERASDVAADYRELAEKFPSQSTKIMQKVLDDKLRIEFMHRGLEDFMGEVDRSSNRLTFGIIVAALVVGSSLVISSEAPPMLFGVPVLGLAGFIVASLLGLWLALQIIRSGKF